MQTIHRLNMIKISEDINRPMPIIVITKIIIDNALLLMCPAVWELSFSVSLALVVLEETTTPSVVQYSPNASYKKILW